MPFFSTPFLCPQFPSTWNAQLPGTTDYSWKPFRSCLADGLTLSLLDAPKHLVSASAQLCISNYLKAAICISLVPFVSPSVSRALPNSLGWLCGI